MAVVAAKKKNPIARMRTPRGWIHNPERFETKNGVLYRDRDSNIQPANQPANHQNSNFVVSTMTRPTTIYSPAVFCIFCVHLVCFSQAWNPQTYEQSKRFIGLRRSRAQCAVHRENTKIIPLRERTCHDGPVPSVRRKSRGHGLYRTPLFSTLDDDPEAEDEDEFPFAPTTERDSYVSETEQAEQANRLAAATAVHSSSKIDLPQEISNSFLQYALSIILGRAIPDIRDGLKPVHRRILWAMHQLGLSFAPGQAHRKCARVVGEVLGKFHPHGDMAVYDALVRLAQDFTTNHPLIDGHGNFGSIDNDPAAAMRYTECKLTQLASKALLQDIKTDDATSAVVDFVPNFDGNEREPTVLPAKVPILLLNGATGIAVGMATNIPPHNLNELLTACTALAQSRQSGGHAVSEKELLKLVPGPDFPTKATILGQDGARSLYTTGNGGITLRATTLMEKIVTGKRNAVTRTAIIVTELPYQVNKAALLEKIAELVNDKKLEGIADLRDESDRDGIRVVIELKRDASAAVVLNNLYKKTQLQQTFSGNFLALMPSSTSSSSATTNDEISGPVSMVPQRFTLREALDSFLDFRFQTIRRKSRFQLSKVESRANIVAGLLLALEKVDKVIEVVRAAADLNAARKELQELLGTNEDQTNAILRLQLGQLTRLNKGSLEKEQAELEESRKELTTLLQNDDAVYDVMVREFREIMDEFGVERKTRILLDEGTGELSEQDLVRNSCSVIVVLRSGYIKRMPLKNFESQKRGTRGKRGASDGGESDDGQVAFCFTCNDHDTLIMVTQNGIAYGIKAYQVPTASRTAKGQPIPAVLPVKADDSITAILPVSEFTEEDYLALVTERGWIKRTALSAFENMTSRGLILLTLEEGDQLKGCYRCTDKDSVLIASTQGKATRYKVAEVRPTGRGSRGVKAMNLHEGDLIAGMIILHGEMTTSKDVTRDDDSDKESILVVTSQGFGKRVLKSAFPTKARGLLGKLVMKFKAGAVDDQVHGLVAVREDDEILVTTAKGILVRQKVSDIPFQGTSATGVRIQKLDDGDRISSVDVISRYDDSEEAEDEEALVQDFA